MNLWSSCLLFLSLAVCGFAAFYSSIQSGLSAHRAMSVAEFAGCVVVALCAWIAIRPTVGPVWSMIARQYEEEDEEKK